MKYPCAGKKGRFLRKRGARIGKLCIEGGGGPSVRMRIRSEEGELCACPGPSKEKSENDSFERNCCCCLAAFFFFFRDTLFFSV